ncbi:restriction endonuclease subunit S [Flammeovirgaceae bacterium]
MTATKKQLVPKLRFKEFKGEWNVKKVGELCDSIVPGRNKPINFGGDIPWITTPDIEHNGMILTSKSGLSISKKEAKSIGSKVVPIDSVIISCVGELGLAAITGTEIVINQQLHAFIPKQSINYKFLLYGLSIQKKYMDRVATKTAVPYMNKDNCNSIPIKFPTLPEQQKIASFLSAVDEKIQQLTRKKEWLEQYKKGVMQRLFKSSELGLEGLKDDGKMSELGLKGLKDDRINPSIQKSKKSQFRQLRFKPENEKAYPKWEEKRLGEISIKKSSNIAANSIEENVGKFKIYGASGLLKHVDFYNEEEPFVSIVKDGAGVGRTLLCDAESSVLGTLDIIKPSSNVSLYFLYSVLNNIDFSKYSIGSTIPHIYFKDYSKEKIEVPCLEEQQKIASFLSSIDTKIESVAHQITQTQSFKKGLLQQMFV